MDRAKNAIIDLGHQIGWIEGNVHHQFPGWQNVTNAMREAASLLKEQAEQIERLEHDLAVTESNMYYYVNGND